MRSPIMLAFVTALVAVSPLHAQTDTEAEIAELRAEVERLTERLEALEARAANARGAQARERRERAAAAPGPEASGGVRLSGDLRYRHETINDDALAERNRQRIRARFDVAADVADDLTLGLRLATGGDNPVSANQSLDGGFSRKSIGVDRAFFDWRLGERSRVVGGKMPIPMFRPGGHPLILDGDLNPEGLAYRYDGGAFFANLAGLWVEERSAADDAILIAAQGGYRRELDSGVSLTAGLSYYDYRDTQGFAPFYDGEGKGNTLDALGNYAYDYDQLELFAEAGFRLGGQPLSVFADYVRNTAAPQLDTGYAVGLAYRDAAAPGEWELGYAYEDLEADAVVATFADSDFSGGGTDGKGHVFEIGYVFRPRWNLDLTYFLGERDVAAGADRDYKRLQADVSFRY